MKAILINLITVPLLTSLLVPMGAWAQTNRDLTRPVELKAAGSTEARTALVIGNASYKHTSPLLNPANDATDMAAMLKGLDFEVISGTDATRAEMDRLIREFGKRLRERGGMGLFYYAGHGVQVEGRNYLIPVDADIRAENEVKLASYDIGWILAEMENAGNNLNIVILDACRNNPFSRSWRSLSDGLAMVEAPNGTLIAFSTAPGRVAADGTGRNGLYTEALLKALNVPDLSEGDLFKKVRADVQAATGGRQTPWEQTSLTGKFVFRKTAGETSSKQTVAQQSIIPTPIPTPSITAPTLSAEDQYWQVVSGRGSLVAYQQYLAEYPLGKYATEASLRIAAIKAEELRKQKEAESNRFNDARRANTKDAFNAYIAAYPNGDYVAQARQGIKDLEVAEEKRTWDDAVILNRKSSFQAYLTAYPNGTYSAQAKTKVKDFEKSEEIAKWSEADGLKTIDAYQSYLKLYPTGEFASLARLRLGDLGVKVAPAGGAPGAVRKNAIGMEFVWIPPGEFMMGSPESEAGRSKNEGPQRRVTISSGFWLSKYEVTQGQWNSVMGSNPSNFKNCGSDCPVEQVSWNDAKEFISRLNAQNDGFTYSLPTEAEWEYAARAGTTTAFAFGDSLSSTQANFDGNYPYGEAPTGPYLERTARVGSYKANVWGLYDMHGNVYEWVEDIYNENGYSGLPTDGSANLTRGDSSRRVLRGGSWGYGSSGSNTRSAFRSGHTPAVRNHFSGFRIAARPR